MRSASMKQLALSPRIRNDRFEYCHWTQYIARTFFTKFVGLCPSCHACVEVESKRRAILLPSSAPSYVSGPKEIE